VVIFWDACDGYQRQGFEMDAKDWAYLAGIVDGEGCISTLVLTRKNGVVDYQLRLSVANTSPALMQWLTEKLGGNVAKREKKLKPTHRVRYEWYAPSRDIIPILQSMLPYLVIKGEQAKLGIELRQRMEQTPLGGRKAGPVMTDRAERAKLSEKIRFLNHFEWLAAETKPTDSVCIAEAIVRAQAN
jgi:hypothetical protein